MLGRKLTDVLVLQQIQSVFSMISYIKMLTSIEIIKVKRKDKKENPLKRSVTGTFREQNSNHKLQPDPSVSQTKKCYAPWQRESPSQRRQSFCLNFFR